MAERWILNVDGAAMVLPLTRQQGVVQVIEQSTPPPEPRTSMAQRPVGSLPTVREWENRQVTLKLAFNTPADRLTSPRNFGSPATEAEGDGNVPGWSGGIRRADSAGNPVMAAIRDVAAVMAALGTSGQAIAGTLTRVLNSGDRITFDVLKVTDPQGGPVWDLAYYIANSTSCSLVFECLPFARGQEQLLGSVNRTTNGRRLLAMPNLTIPGDVPALARLRLSPGSSNQSSVLYAIDQGTAPVERWCSSLDMPPGASLAVGGVGGQVIRRPAYALSAGAGLWEQGVRLTESGVPLTCPGRWRVMLRVRGQAGAQVRLRWAAGSRASGMTSEQPATLTSSQWELVTLGVISVPDGDTLDGVIEARLPHSQPIDYDSILFVPADLQGEQHASRATAPSELIAADLLTGTGALNGTTPPVGSTAWASAGAGAAATRSAVGATRTNVWSASSGVAHYTSLASPSGAVVRSTVDVPGRAGSYGDVGVWLGNAAARAVIAGTQSEPGVSTTGSSGAWGAVASWTISEEQPRWRLTTISGTAVTSIAGAQSVASGEIPVLELTVTGTTATMRVLVNGVERLIQSLQVPAVPSPLEAGITSHGWTASSGATLVGWRDWSAASMPSSGDAALFAGRSAEHATGGARRADTANVWGPVMPEGARPVLPVAGPSGRKTRVVVMATRGHLRDQIDWEATDSLSLSVYATPRYLQVPG